MIAVIGASTSGLFCAYLLAKAGFQVSLFEKQETLGPPKRTLIVTPKISEVLGFVPTEAILNQINKVELFSKDQRANLKLDQPDIILERERLIKILADKGRKAGAVIKTGYEFLDFQRESKGVILKIRNKKRGWEKFKADILIGADGVESRVGRILGFSNKIVLGLIQTRVDWKENDGKTIQIWFDTKKTKYFFWLIPESERTAVVGLIDETPQKAEMNLKVFLKEQGLKPKEFQFGVVPFYQPGLKTFAKNVFLVGDAASQVKTTTVGGLVTGLRGAKALAEAILQNQRYCQTARELDRELFLHHLIRRVLNKFENHDYDKLLGFLGEKTKKALAQYTRDEATRGALKLLLTQPRFLSFTCKLL